MKTTPEIEKQRFNEARRDCRFISGDPYIGIWFDLHDNYCDIYKAYGGNGIIAIDCEASGDNLDTVQAELVKELGNNFSAGTYSVLRHKTSIIAFVEADEIDCAERLANIAICAASRVHWDELDEEESNHYRSVI